MKRNVVLVLALLMPLLLVFQGCSSSSPAAKNSPTPSEAASPDSSSDPEEPSPSACSTSENWSLVAESTISHSVHYMGFLNEKLGITVGYAGETHYSDDGGASWPQSSNKSLCRFGLDIVDENIAWSCGNGNQIRVTKDGGKSWTAVTDYSASGIQAYASFCDDQTGLVGSTVKFGLTTDGGSTWTDLKLPKDDMKIASLFLESADHFYVLSDDGILYCTKDGGETYSEKTLDLDSLDVHDIYGNKGKLMVGRSPINSMSFADENHGTICIIALGSNKMEGYKTFVLTTEDGGTTWESEELEPYGFVAANTHISRDGNFITLQSRGRFAVLKRQ